MEGNLHYCELHELIHSLDQKEKRYFSLFAKGNAAGEAHNYELLFQILARMPVYDPELLRIEMEEARIGTPVAAAKNHLKTMLMSALRSYKAYHDTYTDLLEGLHNLSILYKKRLYGLLRKEIKRLKKLATTYSEPLFLLEIGDYEKRLHKATAQQDIVEDLEEIHAEMNQALKCTENQMEMSYLKDKMLLISKRRSTGWEAEAETVISHPLMNSPDNAMTVFARVYYHQIKAWENHVKNNFQQAKTHWGTVLEILEDSIHLVEEHPTLYQRNLCNYLGTYRGDGDASHIESALEHIRSNPSTQAPDKAETFILSSGLELGYKMSIHDWDGIETMMPELEQGLQAYRPLIETGHLLTFQFHIALYYFLQEDYSACRKWLREITEAQRTERSLEHQRLARVLQLLITWLADDYDLLEHQHRSVKRYFEKHGSNALDAFVMELVQTFLAGGSEVDEKEALERFQRKISCQETHGIRSASILKAWAIAQACAKSPKDILLELEKP